MHGELRKGQKEKNGAGKCQTVSFCFLYIFFIPHCQDPLLTENERLKALLFKIQKDFKAAVPLGGTEVPCHGGSNALIQENEDLKRMNKELEAKLRHEQNTRQVSDLHVPVEIVTD